MTDGGIADMMDVQKTLAVEAAIMRWNGRTAFAQILFDFVAICRAVGIVTPDDLKAWRNQIVTNEGKPNGP